ncbi:MAG: hypothetical protein M9949_03105 [Candidatus Kapabacteria bacterium]|nr:hypothetical protein [Candidatus Kapabacteria bacterium]
MNLNFLLFILLVTLIASCDELVNSCDSKQFIIFGNDYGIMSDPNSYSKLNKTQKGNIIDGDIVKYGNNSDFIVAIQKPVYEIKDKLREEYRPDLPPIEWTLGKEMKTS